MTQTERNDLINGIIQAQAPLWDRVRMKDINRKEMARLEGQIEGLTAARCIIDTYYDEQKRDEGL